jgi:hypothetical protein
LRSKSVDGAQKGSAARNVTETKFIWKNRKLKRPYKRSFLIQMAQSQSINKVPTRFDVYIKGNRNDFFATRGADIAIFTNILTSVILTYFDNFKN